MTPFYWLSQRGEWKDKRGSNVLDGGAPFYEVYETKDGRHVTIAALEPKFYTEFLDRTGLSEESLPEQYDRS